MVVPGASPISGLIVEIFDEAYYSFILVTSQRNQKMPVDNKQIADKSKEVYELLAKDHPTEEEFRILLNLVEYGVLAKRYLHTGLPFVFINEPHKYLSFREAVGRIFDVLPQQISVMGSARFGFSLSPKKQTKNGAKTIDENSDLDLVIVSSEIYQEVLEDLVSYTYNVTREYEKILNDHKNQDKEISIKTQSMSSLHGRARSLYHGYVRPGDLDYDSELRNRLYAMQNAAATQLFGTAPPGPITRIGARIFRTWRSAEKSYEYSFDRLARSFEIRGENRKNSSNYEDTEGE